MYGDDQDIFIDHLMNRAPSFHSVAKLAAVPQGWGGSAAKFRVPGRLMLDLNPRLITRMAIVDNAFHLFWLLPPGALIRQAQDPLIRRDKMSASKALLGAEALGGSHIRRAARRVYHQHRHLWILKRPAFTSAGFSFRLPQERDYLQGLGVYSQTCCP